MKKSLLQIMIANIIALIAGLITNFLLPKYLSFESYALVKTYALYLTYAGFFSLGYNDGMYLNYGGKKISEIDVKDLGKNILNYFVLIILMSLLVLIVGIILGDYVVIAFAFGIFSYNLLGYLKSFYQATGEFKQYGKSLNAEKIMILIFNLVLIFIFRNDNSYYYISIQVICGIITCLYLWTKLNHNIHFLKYATISIHEIFNNIKSGFVLMLGNFSSGLLTGIDRWFIKIFLTSVEFAKYSFAASMENIINVFTTPITVAMYNYFCKKPKIEDIKMFKKASLMWGVTIISLAYPAKYILEHYLTNYISISNVIFILFATQIFNVIVKGIYVNIYKSQKKQAKYFIQLIFMLILASILDFIFINVYKSITLVAIATLITSITWLFICEWEKNNKIRFSINEYLYMFILLIIYILTGSSLNTILGFLLYLISLIIFSITLMKDTSIELFKIVKNMIKKVFKF